jgi:glycosyltransferase involved in cell wall biosynthesis
VAGGKKRVVLLGALPPPLHGQSQMMLRLLEAAAGWKDIELVSLNSRYADSLEAMVAFSWRKVARLGRYLVQLVGLLVFSRASALALSPAFYKGPFLKDSLFIWTAWLLRRRVIAWFQMDYGGVDESKLPRWFKYWQKITLARCHRFVCCADSVVKTLPPEISREKVATIANGLPDCRPSEFTKSEKFRVVYLSTMFGAKGWRTLLEAAENVCEQREGMEFYFYGPASIEETEAELRAIFSKTRRPDHIRYLGPIHGAEKFAMLAQAHLFCLPSFTEAFPLVLLEAMSVGLPVVATQVGGIPDALDSRGGWLVPPNDPKALEAAILAARESGADLKLKGAHNRAEFLKRYTVEAFSNQWELFLEAHA